jgi:uncharacterized protein (DUF1330 family)
VSDRFVNPDRAALKAFAEQPHEGPIHMLNLLRYREVAAYEDGTQASGAQAYETYAGLARPFLAETGASVLWYGSEGSALIGPPGERWDAAFVVAYPSKQAFLKMALSPGYQAIVHHRTAALEDSRLIPLSPRNH